MVPTVDTGGLEADGGPSKPGGTLSSLNVGMRHQKPRLSGR